MNTYDVKFQDKKINTIRVDAFSFTNAIYVSMCATEYSNRTADLPNFERRIVSITKVY